MRYIAAILFLALIGGAACAASFDAPIKNPGFEETAQGNDAPGWYWWRMSDASFHSDTVAPHSGSRCLVITSNSDSAPEIYSRLQQWVPVMPGTEYELTVWARGEDVQPGTYLSDWKSYSLNLPPGVYNWQKISLIFTTKQDQTSIDIGLNVANRCKLLAIDDITLRPTGIPIKGAGVTGSYLAPGRVNWDNSKTNLGLFLTSELKDAATIDASIKAGPEILFEKKDTLKPGENSFQWEWSSGMTLEKSLKLTIRVVDSNGKTVAQANKTIEKMSPAILNAGIDKAESQFKGEFASLYKQCQAKKIPMDYPTATKTMLDQFIPLARNDVKKGDLRLASDELTDFNRAIAETTQMMKFYLKNPKLAPDAVRYKTGKVDVKGISFVGERFDSRGKTSRGPLFFNGYGHFAQISKDIPRWPGYGVNLIQYANFGPSAVFPKEGETDLKPIQDLCKVLDDAAKANVKVDVLLSAHYFPAWAIQKWPQLATGGGGFLNYVPDLPEAKKVMEDFFKVIIPMIKDKPALHSLCLSNEPTLSVIQGAPNTKPMWIDYLTKTHGDVATMNARYGTSYKSFDEVGYGGWDDPQFYDFCIFNKERFAGWHKWMADKIHELAPNVPTHAKICMVLELPARQNCTWGVDAEFFGAATEINGNDCYFTPGPDGGWGSSWQLQNMVYDLQRSLNYKPIFNSENHPTRDGSSNYIYPEHFKTLLWQGAVHGQGSSTIWVWERPLDKGTPGWEGSQCFYGNVMDRPGCALAVGTTTLDLNRYAEEVTALQTKKAPVAILYSKSSFIRNAGYIDAMNRAYESLNFCGVKVDFISEIQLAAGKGKEYKMIVLPKVSHMTEDALNGLLALKNVRLVVIGDFPARTPYGRDLPADKSALIKQKSLAWDGEISSQTLWPVMLKELAALKALPSVSVVDAKTGKPAWGVEWLPTTVGKRLVINMVNLTDKPIDVKVVSAGKEVKAKDLLSLGGQSKVRTLKPITPVLAEITR